jgi:hypothetical protein
MDDSRWQISRMTAPPSPRHVCPGRLHTGTGIRAVRLLCGGRAAAVSRRIVRDLRALRYPTQLRRCPRVRQAWCQQRPFACALSLGGGTQLGMDGGRRAAGLGLPALVPCHRLDHRRTDARPRAVRPRVSAVGGRVSLHSEAQPWGGSVQGACLRRQRHVQRRARHLPLCR